MVNDLLKGTYKERLDTLKNIDSKLDVNEGEFVSEKYGIGVYEEDMTTIVFVKGYYK